MDPVEQFFLAVPPEIRQRFEKLLADAYDRGKAEGVAATDPEAVYGRMLADEEAHRVPRPIWG